MANSADPDQLASSEANWSGTTMFAKAGHIQVQQNKGSEHVKWNTSNEYPQHMFCGEKRKIWRIFIEKCVLSGAIYWSRKAWANSV